MHGRLGDDESPNLGERLGSSLKRRRRRTTTRRTRMEKEEEEVKGLEAIRLVLFACGLQPLVLLDLSTEDEAAWRAAIEAPETKSKQ